MRDYALIVGHGRSGTNWLLDIFDASPETFCRNEPNAIEGSPCEQLAPIWQVEPDMPDMEKHWDDIADWMSSRMGERDHRISTPKDYVYPLSQKLGIAYFTARPKIRTTLRTVLPWLRAGEWEMPWWIGNSEKLSQSLAVLKINKAARVAVWLFQNRPEVPVLHIVRHPGGRLNSWLNRFLSYEDEAFITQRNRDILRQVLTISPEWEDLFGDIDAMPIAESEIWFWRYVTENIHLAGNGLKQYKLIIYEDLAFNPLDAAKEVYEFCGLEFNPEVEAMIADGMKESVWEKIKGTPATVAQAWHSKLKPEDIQSITKVLQGSLMEHWWDG